MEYRDIESLINGFVAVNRGWTEDIIVPAVADATNGQYRTVPGETWEIPIAMHTTLTTDTTVANRLCYVTYKNGNGDIIFKQRISGAVVASTIILLSVAIGGVTNFETANITNSPIPSLLIKSGWQYGFEIDGADAGDTISESTFLVERFPSDIASGDYVHEWREQWRRQLAKVLKEARASRG